MPAFAVEERQCYAELESGVGVIKVNETNTIKFIGKYGGNKRGFLFEVPADGKVSISEEIKGDGIKIDPSSSIEFVTYDESTKTYIDDATFGADSYLNKSVFLSEGWHIMNLTFLPDDPNVTYEINITLKYTADSFSMHRLYNRWTGEHFYTSDTTEKDNLVKKGWSYEGVGWNAPSTSSKPVYRLYNPYVEGGDHHYTMDADEKDECVKAGWTYEGIGWYSDDNKEVPLYRQYNPFATTGTHNYTANKSENDDLVKEGWKAEGTAWYGIK